MSEQACPSSCQPTKRHLFSTGKATEGRFSALSEPAVLQQRGERRKLTGTEKKEIMEAGERRWSAGSRGVPLSSRKVSPAMSIEPKWRRAECSVATDDDRHIYRRKTVMKDRGEGERKWRREITGQ